MMRKVLQLIAMLCFLVSVCFTAQAAQGECSFMLSDVSTQKGRLFSVTLSIKSEEKMASFVGEISFDGNLIEYREAKALDGNSLISVNSKERDKITFVYLCEEGVSCTSKTNILTFKFKANADDTGGLSLSVTDAVNSSLKDVSTVVHNGSSFVASGDFKGANNNKKSPGLASEEEQELSEDYSFTNVDGNPVNVFLVGSVAAFAAVALVIVAYVFYKLGVRKSKQPKSSDGKESGKDEEKT